MLPDGWKYSNLGEIACNVTSGSRDWAQYYSDTGDKFVRMTNLSRDGVRISENDMKRVAIPHDSTDGKRTALKNGDILISITAELGKIGLVPKEFGRAFINQHLALVRLKNATASSTFVAYALSSKKLNQKLNSLNDAGAKAGLNLSTIRSFPLILPPLPEQKKIAAILSTWDRAIERMEKLLANSQQQKKALMQQLLTGKKRLPGFTGEWKKKTLSNVCQIKTGKKDVNEGCENGEYPFFTCAKQHTFSDNYSYDCEAILIAGNGEVGKTHYYNGKFEAYQRTYILSDFTNISVFFLLHFIEFFLPLDISKEKQHGAMPYIKLGTLKDFSVVTPPIAEQRAIATVLTTADEEIASLESDLSRLRQEKKALMQQLLTGKRRVTVD
ncbi:restriction endonuclease subunit S [Gluconobacter oxydans]|uniref:restriction endonuclease subunit S n=1 Tax=Gluconobacter oxydans TaxID=442 RepID=UPI0039EA410A